MPILSSVLQSERTAPTVTGGTTYSDSRYNYRVFTSGSGTLAVSGRPIVGADILCIGGGGGSTANSSYYFGGGGAGGVCFLNEVYIPTGSYTVVIGGSGTASTISGTGILSISGIAGGAVGTIGRSQPGGSGAGAYYVSSNGTPGIGLTSPLTITSASGSGTTITYTAVNALRSAVVATIDGVNPSQYNLESILAATSEGVLTAGNYTTFVVTNAATGTYISGGSVSLYGGSQGNSGGTSVSTGGGGGGGGYSSAGGNASTGVGGNGGTGILSTDPAYSMIFNSAFSINSGSVGGGGGGAGSSVNGTGSYGGGNINSNGITNTGGGGGASINGVATSGGSGVVVVRWPK